MSGRYYGLSEYFKKVYGEKLVKLSLDGGFTCPNRDGTLSARGCIFCSENGSG
ncbi:MAG TPA: TIGR01212 family radical SAM protein, partial [Fusibacter sp.]|nr:TIGR01212 family radical SAM protein [Fusibacter sp.]